MIKKDLNPQKKKLGFSGWLEILVFAFSALHLIFLLLCLFNIFNLDILARASFSYITAFILLGVCLILYFALMLIEKLGKFTMPNWLKCVFYLGFFIFTNIYYTFGLFENTWSLIIFYVYLAFILNIISLSLFYNLQKTDNGIIKTNNSFVAFFTFAASVAAATIIETVVTCIELLANTAPASAISFVANLSAVVLTSLIMSLIFYFSLSKSKRLINYCLIKSL